MSPSSLVQLLESRACTHMHRVRGEPKLRYDTFAHAHTVMSPRLYFCFGLRIVLLTCWPLSSRVRGSSYLVRDAGRAHKTSHIEIHDRAGGRKHVTHIKFLDGIGLSPARVAEQMQRKFAAACTTQPLPQKGAGDEVLAQGCFMQPLLDWLQSECGVPRDALVLVDKRKGSS